MFPGYKIEVHTMKESNNKKNIELNKKKGCVYVSINPQIYPLDVIYAAGYVFLDRAYIFIDGNPQEKIIVEIEPKNKKENLNTIGKEFNNELLNYAEYKVRSEKNAPIRQMIIQRALLTNSTTSESSHSKDIEYTKDPEGIAVPWEEKYRKVAKNKK